jgi:alkane 1-monooxygenase
MDAPPTAPPPASLVLRHWLWHLLSLSAPTIGFAYVLTAPHPWWVALLFLAPMFSFDWIELFAPDEKRQPPDGMPAWPFDAIVYVLFAMQVTTLVLAARLVSIAGLFSFDTFVLLMILFGTSGFSIITAHELIHRRERSMQLMGRIMMGLVLYEHFYTEHLRGHHRRVATPNDPATARFGETFLQFWRRTIPAQFRSAWRLETGRLGDVDMKPWDRRIWKSRVVHGLVGEWAFAFSLWAVFGPGAFTVHVLQAFVAFSALEMVNYFEHWGLERRGTRVEPRDSWDATNKFTLYSMIGLSRHADHHAFASRPYQQLRLWDESPKLPRGYSGTGMLAVFRNAKFRELMTEELRRRKLGPFAEA